MALPVYAILNANNVNDFVAIQASNPLGSVSIPLEVPVGPLQAPMLYDVSYFILSTGASSNIQFQELCPDGQWRQLGTPALLVTTANQPYNGSIPGEFIGVRLFLSVKTGSTIMYIKGAIKTS